MTVVADITEDEDLANLTRHEQLVFRRKSQFIVVPEIVPDANWRTFGYGLYIHTFLFTVVGKFLYAIAYPLQSVYLNLDTNQILASRALSTSAWAMKFWIGILSDILPIRGQRRRPYMIISMCLCFLSLVWMSLKPLPDSYYTVIRDDENDRCYLNRSMINNPEAKEEGISYVIITLCCFLALAFADVAADGLKVEYSKKEAEDTRGSIQTVLVMVANVAIVIGTLFVGIGLNGAAFGGSFCWNIPFQLATAIMAVVCLLCLINSIFFITDRKGIVRTPLADHMASFWATFQSRETFQIFCVLFLWAITLAIDSPAAAKVKVHWAKVSPFVMTVTQLIASMFEFVGVFLLKNFFLNSSWRKVMLISRLISVITNNLVEFITISGLIRNPYFYFADDVVASITDSMSRLVGAMMVIEICKPGLEAVFMSLLVAAFIVGICIGQPIANAIAVPFNISDDMRYLRDSPEDRWMVAYSFIITMSIQFASMPLLLLLPSQKKEIQLMKEKKKLYPRLAKCYLIMLGIMFVASILISVATLNERFACMKLFGGQGCDD